MAVSRSLIAQEAEKLVSQGRLDAAVAQYQRLVKDNPGDMATINKIGDLYSRLGRKKEAVAQFRTIGEHYAKEGFFLKAIAIYKKISKIDPASIENCERLADLYNKQGLVTEARAQYSLIAEKCTAAGEVGRAIEAYRSLIGLNPENLDLCTVVADLLVRDGRAAEAADEFIRVGERLQKLEKGEAARKAFERAAGIQPRNPAILTRLAGAMTADGEVDGAVKMVNQALEGAADRTDLLLLLGNIQMEAGRSDEAEIALRGAAEGAPTRPEPGVGLGRLLLAKGDAVGAFEAICPRLASMVRADLGATAAELLEGILEVEGKHRGALRSLASLYTTVRDEEGAMRCYGRLLDLCMEAEEYGEARQVAETMARLRPDDASLKERVELLRAAEANASPAAERNAESYLVQEARAGAPQGAVLDLPGAAETGWLGADAEPAGIPPGDADPLGDENRSAGTSQLDPDDEDFIAEHMTEADVFVKYGLPERAAEQLTAVIERFPDHVPALQKLKEIHLENGSRDAAREQMTLIVKAHTAAGNQKEADLALEELRRFDPQLAESLCLEETTPSHLDAPSPVGAIRRDERPSGVLRANISGGEQDAQAPAVEPEEEIEIVIDEETPEPVEDSEPPEIAKAEGKAASPAQESAEAVVPEETGVVGDLLELAADLDAALAQDAAESRALMSGDEPTPEGESLDEIVQAFRKGVEDQLGEEDFDGHYNLGIAYKEMGLLDEAIGEFQVAARQSRLLVDACSMLGVCFREKGMPALAARWYRKGLQSENVQDEDLVLRMRYDLAELLCEMDEHQEALDLYTEVYGSNSRYREVASRIQELKQKLDP